jgi:iron-sulfur cluster repair protein YtfE (RIC family)
MKITDALLGEHAVFYAQFDRLEEILPAMERVEVVRELGAMLAAALASHARLEDDLLFSLLDSRLGRDAGPLGVMRMEHEQIELDLQRSMAAGSAREAREALLRAIEEARSHFAKEEQVVFPMAEAHVGAAGLRTLGEQWAAARAVVVATEPAALR